ncbi:MAG: addiction module protein [Candidatus Omnitrophica bacterium]|nr:addiction module protein [Candidatus Omnitrophota bacterium]MCA9419071.1 addiction module protein [Candidatus Omnitrophota bacterium]MCA9425891.1 addiction module protein [Candidatus Omnitrophota bacterium]MCA9434005.1 addiction module protein [Candidatus Omnitrophota bacterium]MCA9443782.1 addiction module protein [Candidatus Omnitrophota bacterium]
MNGAEILRQALALKAEERFAVIEGLIKSLDEPSKEVDEIWAEEAEKRLKAVREGRLETIPMAEVFAEEQ